MLFPADLTQACVQTSNKMLLLPPQPCTLFTVSCAPCAGSSAARGHTPVRAQMLNLNGYKQDFTIFDQRKLLANTVNDDVVLSR